MINSRELKRLFDEDENKIKRLEDENEKLRQQLETLQQRYHIQGKMLDDANYSIRELLKSGRG